MIGVGIFIEQPVAAQVVDIGAFGVYQFAKQSVSCHVHREQFKEVVATILQHHAMALGLLGSFYQGPAIFDRLCSGHFNGYVFAAFHRAQRNRRVQVPGGGTIHEIQIGFIAKCFPSVFSGIANGLGSAQLGQCFLGGFHPVGVFITERHDLNAIDVAESFDGIAAAHAQSDYPYAYHLQFRSRIAAHIEVCRRRWCLLLYEGGHGRITDCQ